MTVLGGRMSYLDQIDNSEESPRDYLFIHQKLLDILIVQI